MNFYYVICNGPALRGTLTAKMRQSSGYEQVATERFVGDRRQMRGCAKYWAENLKEMGWDHVRISWVPDAETVLDLKF